MKKVPKGNKGMGPKDVHPRAPKGATGTTEKVYGRKAGKNAPKRRYPMVGMRAAPEVLSKGMKKAKIAFNGMKKVAKKS